MTTFALLRGAALSLAALMATSAFAADPEAYVSSSSVDWTGFYAGVHGGGVLDTQPATSFGAGPINLTFGDDTITGEGAYDLTRVEGFAGGLHVGSNWQHGSFVFGTEAALSLGTLGRSRSIEAEFTYTEADDPGPPVVPGSTASGSLVSDEAIGLNWLGEWSGRVGFATGNWMTYIRGGVAVGDVAYAGSGQLTGSDPDDLLGFGGGAIDVPYDSASHSLRIGAVVGVGVEAMLMDNVSFGAEYSFVNLPGSNAALSPLTLLGGSDEAFTNFGIHRVQGKLSYHF